MRDEVSTAIRLFLQAEDDCLISDEGLHASLQHAQQQIVSLEVRISLIAILTRKGCLSLLLWSWSSSGILWPVCHQTQSAN
jgi:hypothetical protein